MYDVLQKLQSTLQHLVLLLIIIFTHSYEKNKGKKQ